MNALTAEQLAHARRAAECGESELERKLALSVLLRAGESVTPAEGAKIIPFPKRKKS